MARLEGKVALITGGAQGMGFEHARLFVAEGAKVAITDVLAEQGQAAASKLGDSAVFFPHDVTKPASWKQVLTDTVAHFGTSVTVLVNNAGVSGPDAHIADLSDEDYLAVISVDQHGTFFGMRAVIPGMIEAGGGSIVNISSVAGFVHNPHLPNGAYTTAKFAVRGLTRAAAVEYGSFNIRVNSVHPGGIVTPLLEAAQSAELIAEMAAGIPMRRMGRSDEVSRLVAFLASDEASYVTGSEYVVDGGVLAC